VLTRNPLLLAFGLAGAFLAWSYSSPPLKLSYRGIGEIATFLAFGPIMTVGATVAFGGAGLVPSFLASVVLGLLAAAISFARYCPNRDEDLSKGKRTAVTILGAHRAKVIFVGILSLPVAVGIAWLPVRGGILWIVVLAAFVILVIRSFPDNLGPSERYDVTIALTIACNVFAGVGLVLNFSLGLSARLGRDQVRRRHGHAEKEHRLDRRRIRRNMSRILPVMQSEDGNRAAEGEHRDEAEDRDPWDDL